MAPARALLVHACVLQVVAVGGVLHTPRQLVQAAAPPRNDIGHERWQIDPDLQLVTSVTTLASSEEPDPLTGKAIGDAIEVLKSQGGQVCMSVDKSAMGGLANTMGLVNTAMDIALEHNITWIMPSIAPPRHFIDDSFTDMFGKTPSCEERELPLWKASCLKEEVSLVERHGPAIPEDERVHYGMFGLNGCVATHAAVHGPYRARTSACGCDVIVAKQRTAWHFDYSRTGKLLSQLYWAQQGEPQSLIGFDFPLATVMHIRLGDVEEDWAHRGKFVTGQTLATVVKAFAAASKINPSCLNVTLVTDGDRNDDHVRAVQASWSDLGVQSIRVSDISDPVDAAFRDMTHASILLGGPSGFPRFAAVLSRAQVKVFLNPQDRSHPLGYLEGVTELPFGSNQTEMQQRILGNDALMRAAASCEQWLSR